MSIIKKAFFIFPVLAVLCTGCGMFQSIIKSSFPYTTTLTIPASSKVDQNYSAISMANSFDQNFSKSGNNGNRISQVRVISARLRSTDPTDYNIGNIASVKIYLSKEDGSGEILVASRDDIGASVGNNIVLDIDNTQLLDDLVREAGIKVRMAYKLRKTESTDANLYVILGLAAYPSGQ
jgi:hypothetical protein